MFFNSDLQCGLDRMEVDYNSHVVRLYSPGHNVTDMAGAIKFARRADSQVKRIEAFNAANGLATVYVRETQMQTSWRAYRPTKRVAEQVGASHE